MTLENLISELNNYSGLLIVILTTIGFIYIRRQISIAKNKDIFLNIQQNLESELNFSSKKNFDFITAYLTSIDKCNKDIISFSKIPAEKQFEPDILDKDNRLRHYSNERIKQLYNELWDIMKKYETIFYTKIISLDRWWLNKHYERFLNLKDSIEYKNHINFTRNLFEKCKHHHEIDMNNIETLKEILYSEYKESLINLKKLEEKISSFLIFLANKKKIL